MKQLDRKFLFNYYQDMVDSLYEIFDLFLLETPDELKKINDCIAIENYTAAEDLLHKINPSFSNIGLPNLSGKLKEVEDKVIDRDAKQALLCLTDFYNELDDYMPAIIEEHQRLKQVDNL